MQDAAAIFEYAQRPVVTEYLWWTPHSSIQETRSLPENWTSEARKKPRFTYQLAIVADQKMIGMCRIGTHGDSHRKQISATLCAGQVWERDRNRSARLSQRVLEKAGMTYEARFREDFLIRGTFHDLLAYAIYAILETDQRHVADL